MAHDPESRRRRGLREKLASLSLAGIRVLSRVVRRLGYPALATVPVSAVMLSRLQTVSAEQPLEDVAQLLVGGRCTQLPVVADGVPLGVVTRDDLAVAVQVLGPRAPIGDAHHHRAITVSPTDTIDDVLELLRGDPESVAVVMDRGELVGVLTEERLRDYASRLAA